MHPAPGKEEILDSRNLIKITWALVAMQQPGDISIPLLPKLLEQIS